MWGLEYVRREIGAHALALIIQAEILEPALKLSRMIVHLQIRAPIAKQSG